MMADNIEHVISYWMLFQKFHSPALGGFAVVSHWLPFLLFSVPVGALAESVRSATPHHPVRHAALHHGVARLGLVLRHRLAADVARDAAPRDPRLRGRAVADLEPAAAPRHRAERRIAAKRGAAECDGPLPRHPRRTGGGRRDAARAPALARHSAEHRLLPSADAVDVEGASAARAFARARRRRSSAPCAAWPTSRRRSATSPTCR